VCVRKPPYKVKNQPSLKKVCCGAVVELLSSQRSDGFVLAYVINDDKHENLRALRASGSFFVTSRLYL